MTTVTRSATIAASPARLWGILAELDRYHEWEGGYVSSEYTSDQRSGVGTTREVRLRSPLGVRRATHVVTRWDEPSAIAWSAGDNNFPLLQAAEQTITLRPHGDRTHVENTVVYVLGYGPLGDLADSLMFERVVRGAAEGFLEALAARAEEPDAPGAGPAR